MMDYDPRIWQPTKMIPGYTYSMMYDKEFTLQKLTGTEFRIVDRRFYHHPSMCRDKLVRDWIKFRNPIPLWDAMEAGLVPVFRMEVSK